MLIIDENVTEHKTKRGAEFHEKSSMREVDIKIDQIFDHFTSI